jgi:hypothetical protein
LSPAQAVRIEASDDDGATWEVVIDSNLGARLEAYAVSGTTATFRDYLAPGNQARKYRVFSVNLEKPVYSPSSSVAQGSLNRVAWELQNPWDNSMDLSFACVGNYIEVREVEDQAHYRPLGRSRMVVIRDQIRGAEIKITAEVIGDAEKEKFKALRALQNTLHLVSNYGESWYVEIDDQVDYRLMNVHDRLWHILFTAIEVDTPTGV